MVDRIVVWNEPLWIGKEKGEPTLNSVVRASESDVVKWIRLADPLTSKGRPDDDLLDEFMIVNWAWFEDTPDA